MNTTTFIFGIHCHQPVGNFEHVFEEATQKSYLPFLSVLQEFPKVRCGVHFSGVLFEWLEKNRPAVLELLRELVRRGQVELMTGGFYEPILPLIPDQDIVGQIKMLTAYIQDRFSVTPRGLWLTERVWEPGLVAPLTEAGVEYIVVDDIHFLKSGIPEDQLTGYFLTEENGVKLAIFPIHKILRYLIPFREVQETENLFREWSEQGGRVGVLLDDGEKFGVWPGTFQWVYEEGWLRNFFQMLSRHSWIRTVTCGSYMDEALPVGRVYLGAASYTEMLEWSGGTFKNFLVKYEEANRMHKRMLWVSGKVNAVARAPLVGPVSTERSHMVAEAERALYRSQCNCSYWHGIFGGLYLNYLRHAVYENLLQAERLTDEIQHGKRPYIDLSVTDIDFDGQDEVLVTTPSLVVGITPAGGGSIFELSYRRKQFNVTNVLRRHPETYHQKSSGNPGHHSSSSSSASIHEMEKEVPPELQHLLSYDKFPRNSLMDYMLPEEATLEEWEAMRTQPVEDLRALPYALAVDRRGEGTRIILVGEGAYYRVRKTLQFFPQQPLLEIDYEVEPKRPDTNPILFAVEWNLTLLAGHSDDRYILLNGDVKGRAHLDEPGTSEGRALALVDDWKGLKLLFAFSEPARIWRFPLYTVSQSEKGLEKIYQGTVFVPHWKPDFKTSGGLWRMRMTVKFEE